MSMHKVRLVLSAAAMITPPELAENGAIKLEVRDRIVELDPYNGTVVMPDGFVTSVAAFEHLLAAMRAAMNNHWERYQGLDVTEGTSRADLQHKRIKWLARELANHFADDETPSGRACACTGLSGTCVDCPHWWGAFLQEYTKDEVEAMHDMLLVASNAIRLKRSRRD